MRSYFNLDHAVMLRMRAAAKREARGGQCVRLQQKILYILEDTCDSTILRAIQHPTGSERGDGL